MLIIDAWFFLRWWYLFYFRDWRNKHSWIETWECIWCSRTNIFPWKFYFMYAIYAFVNVYLYWVKTENAFLNLMLCYAKSLQSCLTLCDPIDGSHQAPLSLGFSRQEHWSGLPFLLQCMKVKSESEVVYVVIKPEGFNSKQMDMGLSLSKT